MNTSNKKLYTVLMDLEDRTVGIEQFESESPEQALFLFIHKAKSLEDYNREKLLIILKKRNNVLIHLKNEKGLWMMNFGTDLIDIQDLKSIYGGFIIQTDIKGPERI